MARSHVGKILGLGNAFLISSILWSRYFAAICLKYTIRLLIEYVTAAIPVEIRHVICVRILSVRIKPQIPRTDTCTNEH